MSEDVKTKDQETSPDTAKAEVDTSKKEEANEVADDSLPQSVPYGRFKEKVGEVRDLKREVEEIKDEYTKALERTKADYQTYYESEIAKLTREQPKDDDLNYDYEAAQTNPTVAAYEEKIRSLNGNIEKMAKSLQRLENESETRHLQTEISKLKDVYPSLDEEHVYAVKKMKPKWTMDECAEYSHKKWEELVKGRYNTMMEAKKEAAKKPILGDGNKINIKPEERPKSMAEARKMLMKHVGADE